MQLLRKPRGYGRVRAVASIWLLISVSLIVLALAGSYWVTIAVSGYASQTYQANINGVARMFDREIEHIRSIAAQLSNTAWVRRIMYMQGDTIDKARVSDYSLYEHQRQMATFKQTNSLLSEIGVAFFGKDLVIAAYGKGDFAFLARNAVQVEGMTEEDWRGLGQSLTQGRLYIRDDVAIGKYGVVARGTLIVCPLQHDTLSRVEAALFAVVPHQNLHQFLSPQLLATGAQQAMFKVYGGDQSRPFLSWGTPVNGQARVIQSPSAATGWTIAVELPESIVLTGALRVRNTLLSVVAGMWLISMLFTLLIARKFFAPLERITRMFGLAEDGGRHFIDEYDTIRRGIQALQAQREHLKADLVQRQPMARAAGLQALMTREGLPPQEVEKLMGVLGIRGRQAHYCVCLLTPIDDGETEPDMQELERQLAPDAALGDAAAARMNGLTAALLCVPDKQALDARVTRLLEAFPCFCAVLGEVVGDVGGIPRAYQTALIARDHRIVSEGFRVLRYDGALLSKGGYYLPRDIEYRLLQAVRGGSGAQAVEVFDRLYRQNADQPQATHASLWNFLINIQLDITKLLCEAELALPPPAAWQEGVALDAQRGRVRAYILEASAQFRARIQSTPTRLEDIAAYVRANLCDGGLSLTMVADAFGVSNSLVSRLFSEGMGETFLNYVNRMRIERACERLAGDFQTDILVVARAVGYDNDVTFRRLFKKHTGLTPSQYREKAHSRGALT
ncbi:MAG: helix-turn-helix transcriptional regulator [Clostridiales bacterium]|nr:helix-turn-helix transcriptional regulator [Clostridiales bacterium]